MLETNETSTTVTQTVQNYYNSATLVTSAAWEVEVLPIILLTVNPLVVRNSKSRNTAMVNAIQLIGLYIYLFIQYSVEYIRIKNRLLI